MSNYPNPTGTPSIQSTGNNKIEKAIGNVTGPVKVLLVPHEQDWTKKAIKIANKLPEGSEVYCGINPVITNISKALMALVPDIPLMLGVESKSREINIRTDNKSRRIKGKSIGSSIALVVHRNRSNANKVIPFPFTSYREFPLEDDFFDLAISITPKRGELMMFNYGFGNKPHTLSKHLKNNALWIHMTSSYELESSLFEVISKGSPEDFENPLLRSLFGKNGWHLWDGGEYLARHPERGGLAKGHNQWILFRNNKE